MTLQEKIVILGSIMISTSLPAFSQRSMQDIDIEEVIEQLFQQGEADLNYEAFYNTFFSRYENPYPLNTVTKSQLQSLFFLNEFQISNFLAYRRIYGPIRSKYELIAIEGFDIPTVKWLLYFTTLNKDLVNKSSNANWSKTEVMLRYEQMLEKKKGYTSPDTSYDGSLTQRYSGTPSKLLFRVKNYKPGKYSIGITAEKDPGESLGWNTGKGKYGTDYYAMHLQLENVGIFDQILVGDYSFQSGQGLVYGSGFNLGKGTETIFTTSKKFSGVVPYTSTLESKPFSGISATSTFKNLSASFMVSYTKRDARLQYDSLSNYDTYFENLKNTGLHRTSSEQSARHAINEKNAGLNVNWADNNGKLNIGINSLFTLFSEPLYNQPLAYHVATFDGNKLFNQSIYASYSFRKAKLFNEIAISDNGGTGAILGMIAAPMDNLKVSFLVRNLSEQYASFHGNPFSNSNNISNERGVYLGLQYDISYTTSVSGYFDQYKYPFANSNFLNSTDGYDWLINVTHSLNDNIDIRGNLRQTNKEKILSQAAIKIDKPASYRKTYGYLHLNAETNSNIDLSTRIAWNDLLKEHTDTYGLLLYQQIEWHTERTYIGGRFTIFDAEEFDNRIYVYEHDLQFSFPFPFYYRKGSSVMILIKKKLFHFLKIELKAKRTFYANEQELGSGLEKIKGNKRTKVKLQFLFNL